MIDDSDPHFALGVEHVRAGLGRYAWKDPEHQRRYDLGYDSPHRARHVETEEQRARRYMRELLQRQQGNTFANWQPRKP